MVEISPFHAIRYNLNKLSNLSNLICPPYDVISAEDQAALEAKSEHNAVRLELPREAGGRNRYEAAAALLQSWLNEGVLVRDPSPSLTSNSWARWCPTQKASLGPWRFAATVGTFE